MDGQVVYMHPAWGLIPEARHNAKAVHVQVKFEDDSPAPVPVVHNLDLPYGAPLQPNEWVPPIVIVNPIFGGVAAPQHILGITDGNTITIGRAAGGPGTAVTYDVWICRPKASSWWV